MIKTKPNNILVCRTDAIGDALLALPVCAALKRSFPGARITLLVSAYAYDLLDGQPGTDEVWACAARGEHAGGSGLRRLRDRIRAAGFDTALLVFPDRRVSWAVSRAGVPRRVGTGRRWWSFLYTHRVRHHRAAAERHEADYNLDLVRALGVSATLEAPRLRLFPEAQAWADGYLQALGVNPSDRLVLLHPGSRGSAANWPPETYGRLAQRLNTEPGVRLLLTGSPAERGVLQAAAAVCSPAPACLTEAVGLKQFAALLARAAVFVSGNTGPMHIASLLGVPTVSVFPSGGVTGPVRWRPLGPRATILTPPTADVAAITPEAAAEAVTAAWLSPPNSERKPA